MSDHQSPAGAGADSLTGAELVNPYDNNRQKSEQVEEMFDSIAPAYDFMNTAMTFGLHRYWRNRALSAATRKLTTTGRLSIIDIATGTGDVAFNLHRRFAGATIKGVDLSEGMLEVARKKLATMSADAQRVISFERGDSLDLKFADATFDLVTVAYGVRNFQHLDRGLAEMARVLKAGGVLCIIELSEPVGKVTRPLYKLYSQRIIPAIGRMVSGDSRAYSYLPESIAAAPQRDRMAAMIRRAGFADCRRKSLTFGAVTYYIATK